MIKRISGTMAVISTSFSIFMSADFLAESIADRIKHDGIPVALLSKCADAISPIGVMIFICPFGLGLWYWLLDREDNGNERLIGGRTAVVWHIIAMLASLLLLSFSVTVARYFIYLNGPRPVSATQWIGNGIISAVILSGIVYGIIRKGTPNK